MGMLCRFSQIIMNLLLIPCVLAPSPPLISQEMPQ